MHYFFVLLTIFLSSCTYSFDGNNGEAKVSNLANNYSEVRAGYHTVIRGETLNSISRKYRVSLYSLTKANKIRESSTIYPGQSLRIANLEEKYKTSKITNLNRTLPIASLKEVQTKKVSQTSHSRASNLNEKESFIPPKRMQNSKTSKSSSPILDSNKKWRWPVKGRIIRSFNSELTQGKGIHIKGNFKTPIISIADGVVVYSGNALKGYGNLIIIKHDNNYLSAYAHNHENVVKEGETVKSGQHIANMGKYYDDSVLLHFELRKNGRPVDPVRYIRPS